MIEALEERLVLTGGLLYQAVDASPLTLRLSDAGVVEIATTTQVLASKRLGDFTTGVLINGAGYNVNLTLDASVPQIVGGIQFVGGSGNNTLIGPNATTNGSSAAPVSAQRHAPPPVLRSGSPVSKT